MSKRLEHQTEALYWLLGRCPDTFVKAWIHSEMESMIRAGGTPDNSIMAKYKIEDLATKPEEDKER